MDVPLALPALVTTVLTSTISPGAAAVVLMDADILCTLGRETGGVTVVVVEVDVPEP